MEKKISVIMGIYNCASTLGEALDSIINQTYKNWEIIMCDDCSSDNTIDIAMEYIKKYPNKIKLLRNDKNLGLNYTLNKCIQYTTGDYIARMDGDDLCYPERFEKQIEVLENNPEIAIVSTEMEFFDENGTWGKNQVIKKPENKNFLKRTPFCHAACMVRKEAYVAVQGYTVANRLLRVEDYHLWVKMYEKGFRGINIQEPLYKMRDDRSAQNRKKFRYRLNESYVKAYAIKKLNLPIYGYIYCLKPIITGMIPAFMYRKIHRRRLGY